MEVGEFGGRFHRAFGSILGPMRPKSEHTESYSIVYGIINCEGRKGQNHNRFGLLLEWWETEQHLGVKCQVLETGHRCSITQILVEWQIITDDLVYCGSCMASQPDIRTLVLNNHIPPYLYHFLNTVSKTQSCECILLISLGVIGALIKVEDTYVINFLPSTETILLCLRAME